MRKTIGALGGNTMEQFARKAVIPVADEKVPDANDLESTLASLLSKIG